MKQSCRSCTVLELPHLDIRDLAGYAAFLLHYVSKELIRREQLALVPVEEKIRGLEENPIQGALCHMPASLWP